MHNDCGRVGRMIQHSWFMRLLRDQLAGNAWLGQLVRREVGVHPMMLRRAGILQAVVVKVTS